MSGFAAHCVETQIFVQKFNLPRQNVTSQLIMIFAPKFERFQILKCEKHLNFHA